MAGVYRVRRLDWVEQQSTELIYDTKPPAKDIGSWPDFLIALLPYLTFIIFGANSNLLMNRFPCSAPLTGSTHTSLESSPTTEVHISLFPQQIRENFSLSSSTSQMTQEKPTTPLRSLSPGPSTFSQRVGPNSLDPFMHRRNPSLTIKITNDNVNRNRKGKCKISTTISKRKSNSCKRSLGFERTTRENDGGKNGKRKESDISASSGKDTSAMKSGVSMNYGRRSPQTTAQPPIIKNGAECGSTSETSSPSSSLEESPDDRSSEVQYHKQFSFEKRSKVDSIIEIPPNFEINTNENNGEDKGSLKKPKSSPVKVVVRRLSSPPFNGALRELPIIMNSSQSLEKERPGINGTFSSSQKQRVTLTLPVVSFARSESRPPSQYTFNHTTNLSSPSKSEKSFSDSSNPRYSVGTLSTKSYCNNGGFTLTPRENLPLYILNRNYAEPSSIKSEGESSGGLLSKWSATSDLGFYEEEKMREFRRFVKSWNPGIPST
ncbi:2458_t:CDS:2 [Acaulospora colombiana]|uniref:2458_t:CDS:1 n=1 Tax=Acaulospora colombiana TaxID=27376 RepID=A0ACA9KX07_9GLOM|nr:2458_t:CDS:2 [Acaulospora colombiana]